MTAPIVISSAPSPCRPFAWRSFGLSDRGRLRPANQDRFLIVELPSNRGHVFAVADGMAGHPAGEVASGLAVKAAGEFWLQSCQSFSSLQADDEEAGLKEVEGAFLHANARLLEESAKHPAWRTMGTTLTMARAVGRKLFVAHAGHSRCYLFSGRRLRQLTQDHTVAAEMVRWGDLSPEAAARHPLRHLVTNVLEGSKPAAAAQLRTFDLHPDDVLLLCSDGLTEMVPDDRIAAILQVVQEPQRACECLVAEANERGGRKNITVIVARIEGPPSPHTGRRREPGDAVF